MNIRAVATLAAGIVLAAAAVLMVNKRLGQEQPEAMAAPFAVAPVVVAAHDISYGSQLSSQLLQVSAWPETSVPQGAFAKVEDVLGAGKEERVALKPIVRGEPVLASKVSGFGGRATMSSAVPEGKRAFSIPVNDISGVAGFLLPGDRVDVLLTRTPEEEKDRREQITDVILQNVVVRGIDQSADEGREKPQVVRAVTVEVTPDEAQKLALATQVGTLTLALRNVASMERVPVRTVRVADLTASALAPKKQAETPQPVRNPPTVRVRRGAEVTNVVLGF